MLDMKTKIMLAAVGLWAPLCLCGSLWPTAPVVCAEAVALVVIGGITATGLPPHKKA